MLVTELADWRRFGSARELMAYSGLVPREHSSGERQRRGSIMKAGKSHVRHVLVQAAWSYRFAPKVGGALKRLQFWPHQVSDHQTGVVQQDSSSKPPQAP